MEQIRQVKTKRSTISNAKTRCNVQSHQSLLKITPKSKEKLFERALVIQPSLEKPTKLIKYEKTSRLTLQIHENPLKIIIQVNASIG